MSYRGCFASSGIFQAVPLSSSLCRMVQSKKPLPKRRSFSSQTSKHVVKPHVFSFISNSFVRNPTSITLFTIITTLSITVLFTKPSIFSKLPNPFTSSPLSSSESQKPSFANVYGYTTLDTFDHDTSSFTQGLVYNSESPLQNTIWESSGGFGDSELRLIDIESGEILKRKSVHESYFAEGLTYYQGKLYQLTWRSELGIIYDSETLQEIATWKYSGEGWGLTVVSDENSGAQLYMSDGSDRLKVIDLETFDVVRELEVFDGNQTIPLLNELQFIDGYIWANIWGSFLIARIDPMTGKVHSWIDFQGILKQEHVRNHQGLQLDVFNGIAYDSKSKRIFVTGKRWPKLFQIQVEERVVLDRNVRNRSSAFFLNKNTVNRIYKSMSF